MSREKILAAIRAGKPADRPLPELNIPVFYDNLIEKYTQLATGIGAKVYEINHVSEVKILLGGLAGSSDRIITTLEELSDFAEAAMPDSDPHTLENVELAIIRAELGVAENSSLWIPESSLIQRALPFICQHLAVIVDREKIVPTMHQAYEIISDADYGYGVFIAGPSKTADIEQSLVLGAHGPRSLAVFILG